MTPLNWSKARQDSSMRFNGSVDKTTDREWRENDRAAKWLAKVEAPKPKSSFKSKKRTPPKQTEERGKA